MAVYTEVSVDEASGLLERLGLGELTALQGISSGIENTNYFASTAQQHWVLTLFERLPREELPYYLHLMLHLSQAGLPVPRPQASADGELVHTLTGKPAAVVSRVPGQPMLTPEPVHCAQLGALLGRMHRAAESFEWHKPHGRGLAWWEATLPQILPHVTADESDLLRSELRFQQALAASAAGRALPMGHVHADLFRDNVMFDGADGALQISGLLDFYFAGQDALLFDVAVCINDWCIDLENGRLLEDRAEPLLRAYRAERELAHGEWRLLPGMLRAAALRFWISRLWDWYMPRSASLLTPKSPAHFERVLRERIDNPWLPAS